MLVYTYNWATAANDLSYIISLVSFIMSIYYSRLNLSEGIGS